MNGDASFVDRIQLFEVELICRALQTANGNQRKAAEILGLKATTLNAKMKRYEIDSLIMSGQFYRDFAF
jgi:transcriptional regulator with GAF, ATPase, and Fis domain